MVSTQIERLQQDSSSLSEFIQELLSKGNKERAQKIRAKKRFLDERIAEIMVT